MQNLLHQWRTENIERGFDSIHCSIASPQTIRSWSYGEVRTPETINYRTFKPEREGLFCGKIFGPTKDFECQCGKYKRIKHRGVVCEKCGVEVTTARVRRERMGHIELAAPVAHIWFLKSMPSRLAMVLDMMQKHVEQVLYFEAHVVVDPRLTTLKMGQVLNEEALKEAREEYGLDAFVVGIGGEAIQQMLRSIDLEEEIGLCRRELDEATSVTRQTKVSKRLKLLSAMKAANVRPDWMVLTVLPVLPPDLRPLVPIEGGRFTSSDLNDLYRRVVNRNNRLKRLLELHAPDIIVRNEKRMLQEAVDALLDNGRRGSAVTGANRRPLKSLSDMVRGKTGRFRQNLLGKRVDYSGRSVIVVGPTLRLHQCGLPQQMALELFKPFVFGELQRQEHATTIRAARKLVDARDPVVWDALATVIHQHPVLLNRAPTLHRLGIQAFEPVLVEGKAIQLHPLVCTAFNADFDGDQMAVHVPLTLEAQVEARVLMMSTNNILSPANGHPIIVPSRDVVLGLYYLTRERVAGLGEGSVFPDRDTALAALDNEALQLHARIRVRVEGELVETTPGRLILSRILPPKVPFAKVNRVMNLRTVREVLTEAFERSGLKDTVVFADQLMYLGFHYATVSGLSMAMEDLKIPPAKAEILQDASSKQAALDSDLRDGLISTEERTSHAIDIWGEASQQVESALQEHLRSEYVTNAEGKEERQDSFNPLFVYADSGARGSPAQMRQLAGMRGLMARPDGSIIETPIKASFREGLSIVEYFMSTHGARKGLTDTALKTANSGYLTRRLVDVSHSLVIVEEDCGAKEGLTKEAVINGGKVELSLAERIIGRVLAEDAVDGEGKTVLEAGTLLDWQDIELLEKGSVYSVVVRSPVTCKTSYGICAKCYGRDLARGRLVGIGEAVGVVAAQSIGEPGTQLTMRTFHIGGAASRSTEEQSVVVGIDGTLKFRDLRTQRRSDGVLVAISRSGALSVIDELGRERERYKVPRGAEIRAEEGGAIKAGDTVAEWQARVLPVLSEGTGKVLFDRIEQGTTASLDQDLHTGEQRWQILPVESRPTKGKQWRPMLQLVESEEKFAAMLKKVEKIEGVGSLKNVQPTTEGLRLLREKVDEARARLSGNKAKNLVETAEKEIQAGMVPHRLADGARVRVSGDQQVGPADVLAESAWVAAENRDITGGLPKVIDLFEARKPKDLAVLAEQDGVVSFGKDTKVKSRLVITPDDPEREPTETMVPKHKQLWVSEGDRVEKGEVISEGEANLHDLLRLRDVDKVANILCQEVLEIYRLQGVSIAEKHIEVILRQMLRNVEITAGGGTSLLSGDQVPVSQLAEENRQARENGAEEASFNPVLLGITKAALCTDSFISAASFQETTKVLTEAAVTGRVDRLRGLKENVIVGRLIPAGTGFHVQQRTREEEEGRHMDSEEVARELGSALNQAQDDGATA